MTISEMQQVCDIILSSAGKSTTVKLGRNNAKCSRAHIRYYNSWMTIAPFIFDYAYEIQLAEIIHESCHFLSGCDNHGLIFREKEVYWLKKYGLEPICYKHAYYRFIKTAAGQLIPTRGEVDINKITERYTLQQAAIKLKKRIKLPEIKL